MEKKPLILAVGANPAWQKVLYFNSLRRNSVNRAENMWAFASGKGINFARAAFNWARADVKLLQFAGGNNGKLLLDDLARESLQVKSIAVETPTRCCVTCLSGNDNSMTELIEPSQAPGAAAEAEALEYIRTVMLQADAMALCGQLPSGMAVDFYIKCAQIAAENGKRLLIDSWKNIAPVLKIARRATLKINRDELSALTGISEVKEAVKLLLNSYDLEYAAITDGSRQAYFAGRDAMYVYTIPEIGEVVNPVGSGDTASAVFFSSLLDGISPEEAFAFALAAASANCLSMKCGDFDVDKAFELYENIKVDTL